MEITLRDVAVHHYQQTCALLSKIRSKFHPSLTKAALGFEAFARYKGLQEEAFNWSDILHALKRGDGVEIAQSVLRSTRSMAMASSRKLFVAGMSDLPGRMGRHKARSLVRKQAYRVLKINAKLKAGGYPRVRQWKENQEAARAERQKAEEAVAV